MVGDSVDGDQAYAKDLQLMEHNGQTSQTAAGTLASVLELQNVPLNELPNPDMTSPIVSDMQSKAHTDITSELTAGGVLNEAVSMTNQMEGTLAQTAEKVMMDTLTSAVETGNTGVMENVQAAAQLDEVQAQPGLGLRGGFQQVAQNAATDATQSQQTSSSSSSSSSDHSLGSVILNGIEGFIDDVIS